MDTAKFDDIVLAILWHNQRSTGAAWKGLPWDASDRLYKAGLISNPRGRRKSVDLTDDGQRKAEAAFRKHFGDPD
ncbi:MAG: DUF6429 family protein [Elusimicrobia bacterium]|jgi:hypothetical protein|nr:DUF6429 family protein [Elusimicrobiota bacterium]